MQTSQPGIGVWPYYRILFLYIDVENIGENIEHVDT